MCTYEVLQLQLTTSLRHFVACFTLFPVTYFLPLLVCVRVCVCVCVCVCVEVTRLSVYVSMSALLARGVRGCISYM